MKKIFKNKFAISILVAVLVSFIILPTFHVVYAGVVADFLEDAKNFFVDALEGLISIMFLSIGAALYALVCLVVGESFSIEKVIFNQYPRTLLSFFKGDPTNPFLGNSSSGILYYLGDLFSLFKSIAIIVYVIILIYIGIQILLNSTAQKKAKHKELLLYWVEGIAILFLFPYVMKFAIQINNAFVAFIYANLDDMNMPVVEPQTGGLSGLKGMIDSIADLLKQNDDYMGQMYKRAWEQGSLTLTIAWYVMFFQMIGFLVSYFRRMLMVLFLIAIFPLVMISYAIDKVGDKKSQVFEAWVNEFMVNVFNQSFHAIAYAILMMIVFNMMGNLDQYWLFALFALGFISKGDDFLRSIFKMKSSADTLKGVGQTIGETVAFSKTVQGARGLIKGAGTLGGKIARPIGAINQLAWKTAGNNVNTTKAQLDRIDALGHLNDIDGTNLMPSGLALDAGKTYQEYRDDIQSAVDVLLGKNPNATAEDYVNAANKLNEYRKQMGNKNIQDAYKDVMSQLLADQNDQLKALMQLSQLTTEINDGRVVDIDLKQHVDLIISALRKDANGNLTPQSKAMLNQIVNNGGDIYVAAALLGMKFNKERVGRDNSGAGGPPGYSERGAGVGGAADRVQNNEYFQKRDAALRKHKGRSAAQSSKAEAQGSANSAYQKARASGGKKQATPSSRTSKRVVGKAKGAPGRASAALAKRTARNTAMANQGFTNGRTKKRVRKREGPWKRVTDASGRSVQPNQRMKFKVVKVQSRSQMKSNLIHSKSHDRPKNSDKLSLFVRYGYLKKDIPTNNQTPSGTSYASKVPQKTSKFKMNPKTSRKGLHEYIQEKKETQAYIEEESRQRKSARSRRLSKTTGMFAIQRNIEAQRRENHNQQKQASAPVVYSSSSGSSARSMGSTNTNVGAHIANVSGGVEEIQKVLQGMDIKQIRFDKDTHTMQVDTKNLVDYIDTEIKTKNISEEAKADMEQAAIYASRLANAAGGDDNSSELFKMVGDMRKLSEKYQNSANPEERELFKEIVRNLGRVEHDDCVGAVDKFETSLRTDMMKQPDLYTGDMAVVSAWNKYDADSQMIDLETKNIDPNDKKYLQMAIEYAFILKDSTSGKYTATEILHAIQQLKSIQAHFDAMEPCDAKTEAEGIINGLGSSLEDYETHVRIMILNDPDSVGNNEKIMADCKKYVRENYDSIPDILRGGLKYKREDLTDENNLKYARQIDNSQVMSDDRRRLMRDRYETQLRVQQAESEIAKLEKEKKEQQQAMPGTVWNIAKNTAEAVWDANAFAVSLGAGVVTAGAATSGKSNAATEAATAFFVGANSTNSLLGNAKDAVSGIENWAEDRVDDVRGEVRSIRAHALNEERQQQKAFQEEKWTEVNRMQKVLQEYYYISNKAKDQLSVEQQQELEVRIHNLEGTIAKDKAAEADERIVEIARNEADSYENGLRQFITDNHLKV